MQEVLKSQFRQIYVVHIINLVHIREVDEWNPAFIITSRCLKMSYGLVSATSIIQAFVVPGCGNEGGIPLTYLSDVYEIICTMSR